MTSTAYRPTAGSASRAGGPPTREQLRAYSPLRVNISDQAQLAANLAHASEIHDALWAIAEPLARESPESQVPALYLGPQRHDRPRHHPPRGTPVRPRARDGHPPDVLGSVITLGMVGFHAGLSRHRSLVSAILRVVVLGAVITLVVDLDRPRSGFLQVSQQPILDLIEQIGPPPF